MKARNTWVAFFCSLIISLLMSATASADNGISHNSSYTVNPDFNSGHGFGWGSGDNAVITHISTYTDYYVNEEDQTVTINVTGTVSGVWGDPTASNPWYDQLEETGAHAWSNFSLNEFFYNGKWWEADSIVSATTNIDAYLFRDEEHTMMNGYVVMYTTIEGALPYNSWSYSEINAPGHPPEVPDFTMSFGFSAMAGIHESAVPAPGALALLGLAGLVGSRRRTV